MIITTIMMMVMNMIEIILKNFKNINENLLPNLGADSFYICLKGV
ncbi:hypothetical protein NT04LM_0789 [Listeria monocytogenes FSL F2-208]|nr:hypothetical protein NT04LM_0789 [Listeria monocytogenes FSL F2-208]